MKNVVIYARVSTLEQAENGYSLEGQINQLKLYAKSMGFKVLKTYKDGGFSGSNMKRPGLESLLQDIKAGTFDVVLVYRLDRLSRSQRDTLEIIENHMLKNNVDLISITESFDTSTPFGRAMVGILSVFAQLERENILERMAMGKLEKAKQGKFNGTKTPWAYDLVDGEFVPNENAKYVQMAYQMYIDGYGIPAISKKIPNKSRGQVRGWLMTPVYAGYRKFKDIVEKGDYEPIVSYEDYLKVQDIMKERAQPHGSNATKNPLAGLCFCKYCGGLFTRRLGKKYDGSGHYTYLACHSKCKVCRSMIKDPDCPSRFHRMEEVLGIVKEEIDTLDYDKEYYKELQDQEETYIDYTPNITETEEKIERLVDLYINERINLEIFEKKKEVLYETLQEYKMLKNQEDLKKEKSLDKKVYLENLRDNWDSLDNIKLNNLLKLLINKIIISNDEIEIKWNF